jgi:FAD/FMN-containing dehydrogenase
MPAAILRCRTATDIQAGLQFARRQGLPVAVKGGGHSYAGLSVCEGGLMLDLSRMTGLQIDAQRKRAFAEPGLKWRDFNEKSLAEGLATTGGTVSSVGIAGYTLGGGTGYLSRKHGMALDNLVSVEVVTADGRIIQASDDENPDLFWGLRGGGGNFGVVTLFEFELYETDAEMFAGQIIYSFEDSARVLRAYREVMATAPDELVCYPCFIHIPPIPAFPKDLHGKVAIDLVVGYCGDLSRGEDVSLPLRQISEPIMEAVGPTPYLEVQQFFDPGVPAGQRWHSRGQYMEEISDEAIAVVLKHTEELPGALSFVYFEPLGGAISRVDPAATAFPHRDAIYSFHINAGWMHSSEDAAMMEWTRSFHEEMKEFSSGGVYVNLLSEDEKERIPTAYGLNYDRLVKLKQKWDPENVFQHNYNIAP